MTIAKGILDMKTTILNNSSNSLYTSSILRYLGNCSLGLLLACFTTSLHSQTTVAQRELIRIKIESKTYYDQTVLYLQENASMGFDSKYDAYKILNPKINIYTSPTSDLKLSINAISNGVTSENIPLCFSSKEPGLHKLKITQYTNPDLYAETALIDTYTHTTTPLSLGQEFEFEVSNADSGKIISDRYFISIQSHNMERNAVITSNKDAVMSTNTNTEEDAELFPNPTTGTEHMKLHMNHHNNEDINVEIDNIAGKEVEHFSVPFSDDIDLEEIQTLHSGVYIIHVQQGNELINKKVVKN